MQLVGFAFLPLSLSAFLAFQIVTLSLGAPRQYKSFVVGTLSLDSTRLDDSVPILSSWSSIVSTLALNYGISSPLVMPHHPLLLIDQHKIPWSSSSVCISCTFVVLVPFWLVLLFLNQFVLEVRIHGRSILFLNQFVLEVRIHRMSILCFPRKGSWGSLLFFLRPFSWFLM